jgi:hypothetical protein
MIRIEKSDFFCLSVRLQMLADLYILMGGILVSYKALYRRHALFEIVTHVVSLIFYVYNRMSITSFRLLQDLLPPFILLNIQQVQQQISKTRYVRSHAYFEQCSSPDL